jgi:hypothetical protein
MSLLTDWFSATTEPARDGVYLTRRSTRFGPTECWHAMRWHGGTRSWYAADTSGSDQSDVIGWEWPNAGHWEWRGLAKEQK